MSSISILKCSTRVAAVVATRLLLYGLLSPAAASDQNSPAFLTSHSPWLAPIVHRKPTRANVPRTRFCRRGSESNRFSMRNSIVS
jgi:hypothetical protein